ncbi:MAG: diphosphomevalonate/mevalonate 3,5-bisphosphate decarboxylase family protein [Bacteroidia bacterium]
MSIEPSYEIKNLEGTVKWSSPSNIALVKYWGKKGEQIPANPSISFTLKHCKSTTEVHYDISTERKQLEFSFLFEGKEKKSFEPKLQKFFDRISINIPFLKHAKLEIHSENSFPHSSGIASSASAMSALSLCLMNIKQKFTTYNEETFLQRASYLARLGSGSACRSVYPTLASWGKHNSIENSCDEYATPFTTFHEVFATYQDTVLLVDKGEKKVSSTVGHNLMINHPFAERRFEQAHENLFQLKHILEKGDVENFIKLVESEALTLHAMMMTSKDYYLLFMPNTIKIIHEIMTFREQSKIPVCFTLDAGANVHVLYPEAYKQHVMDLIKNNLVAYCQNGEYICDEVGSGSEKLK